MSMLTYGYFPPEKKKPVAMNRLLMNTAAKIIPRKGLTLKRKAFAWTWAIAMGFLLAPFNLPIWLFVILVFFLNLLPYIYYVMMDNSLEKKERKKSNEYIPKKDSDYIRDMFFNNLDEFKEHAKKLDENNKSQ